jgi:hypothetical protein
VLIVRLEPVTSERPGLPHSGILLEAIMNNRLKKVRVQSQYKSWTIGTEVTCEE